MTKAWPRLTGLAVLAVMSIGVAGAARAADPLFASELPRYRTGAQVLDDCTSKDPAAQGRCAGYVMAVADMLGGASASIDGLQACLHGDERLGDLIEVVRQYLADNPVRTVLKGDGAVAYALSLYRPCTDTDSTFEDRLLNRKKEP